MHFDSQPILLLNMMMFLVAFLAILLSPSYKILAESKDLSSCDFPAMYNFGDSNSDTGGIYAAFFPTGSPSGETYFNRPSGRASDGRLIIDFLSENLGFPFLSAYLDSIGTTFGYGANFATGGARILRSNESWFVTGMSPFPLDIQVEHFTQLKDRSAYFYQQGLFGFPNPKNPCDKSRLPRPEDFSKALYTFDIGQNDLAAAFSKTSNMNELLAAIPGIINQFASQIRDLYDKGARVFWIHNTGPIGCLPVTVVKVQVPSPAGYLDEHGCVKNNNDIAKEFNNQLKKLVFELRTELSGAALTYVDMYKAKYELISTAKLQGFEEAFTICCGIHGIGYDIWCGNKGNVNGSQVYAASCKNPSQVISWDGVHYTDAANHWIANRILNGSYSDPPLAIGGACHSRFL